MRVEDEYSLDHVAGMNDDDGEMDRSANAIISAFNRPFGRTPGRGSYIRLLCVSGLQQIRCTGSYLRCYCARASTSRGNPVCRGHVSLWTAENPPSFDAGTDRV